MRGRRYTRKLKQSKQEGAKLKAALRSQLKDNHQRKVLGNIKNQLPNPPAKTTRGRRREKTNFGGGGLIEIERYKLKF